MNKKQQNNLPAWDLSDLYKNIEDPKITSDIRKIEKLALAFSKDYKGKINKLTSAEFLKSIRRYEEIDIMSGKLMEYAFLELSTRSDNKQVTTFYQNTNEQVIAANKPTIFYTLEINKLSNKQLSEHLKNPDIAHYKPWLDMLRILKKYELDYSIIGDVIKDKKYIIRKNQKILADIPTDILVTPPKIMPDFSFKENLTDKIISINNKNIYERYDHTVGTRTKLDPIQNPQFNILKIWEENCDLAVYTFSSTVKDTYKKLISASNLIKSKGFTPVGITNCLNFTNPEISPTMYEFQKTIQEIKKACNEISIPVCSGNVSFYNESSNTKIINMPTFTMLGLNSL